MAIFFDKSSGLDTVTKKITFLLDYIEIGPLVSAKKIVKIFYQDIRVYAKISPSPGSHYFNESSHLEHCW